ncbi:MAG: YgfZ/GcvT domain-containing protein [Bosea sp. (in: a-proteobacteria)]
MTQTLPIHLVDRAVLRINGAEARSFLQGLVTCDMDAVSPEKPGFGALLTPQGKIIADFFIVEADSADGGGFLLDVPLLLGDALAKRLGLYKLRAQVTIENLSETAAIVAAFSGTTLSEVDGIVFTDPRLPAMGKRAITDRAHAATCSSEAPASHAHRIAQGVPDGGKDFTYGDAFPHETLMDQLGGVSFSKGCYVGQEIVSRMQHRGTARTRIVPIRFADGVRSEWGVEVMAGGKLLGKVGSTAEGRGLAMLRLDKVADALATGEPLLAGGMAFTVEKPAFATFPFPGDPDFGGPTA